MYYATLRETKGGEPGVGAVAQVKVTGIGLRPSECPHDPDWLNFRPNIRMFSDLNEVDNIMIVS